MLLSSQENRPDREGSHISTNDARASLETIRRMEDHSIDAYVRHACSWPAQAGAALSVFAVFASFDLTGPWSTAIRSAGIALAAAGPLMLQWRAPVRRRFSRLEMLYAAAAGVGLVAVYVILQVAVLLTVWRLGAPLPHTIAAAATALVILASTGPNRRALAAVVRRAGTTGSHGVD